MRIGIIGGGPGGLMTAYFLDRKSPVKLQSKYAILHLYPLLELL